MNPSFLQSLQQQEYTKTESFSKMNNIANRLFKENYDLKLKNKESIFRKAYEDHKIIQGKEEREVAQKEKIYVSLQTAVNDQNKGSKEKFLEKLNQGLNNNESKKQILKEKFDNVMPPINVNFFN